MKRYQEFFACLLTLALAFFAWIYSGMEDQYEQLQIMKAFFSVRISSDAQLEHIYLGTKKSMSTIMSSYKADPNEIFQMEHFLKKNGWNIAKKEEDNNSISLYYEKDGFLYLLSNNKNKGAINEIVKQK